MRRSGGVSRDVVILYGEEADQWNVYLRKVFLQHLDPGRVCSFRLGHLRDLQTSAPTLTRCCCKFVVLTRGLLQSLSVSERQLLSRVLQPPASVVLLRFGVPSSDQLYQLLPMARAFWEVSADQEPWEYLSMVTSIIESGPTLEPQLTDFHAEMDVKEDPTEVLVNPDNFTEPLLVMPNHIPCKSAPEIYLLLKHHLSLEEEPEVVLVMGTRQWKVQARVWNSQTVCVTAVDLPAGSVTLKLHSRGILLGTAQLIYFSPIEEIERLLLKVTDPVEFIRQAFQISTQTQLDELLTKSLQNSLPPSGIGAFQSVGTGSHSPPPHSEEDSECPTLLHFAARNGFERLTALLLDCPGATQASVIPNCQGERPGELAERYGFQHIRELMDRFTESGQSWENQSVERIPVGHGPQGAGCEDNIYEMMIGLGTAEKKCGWASQPEEVLDEEDPYVLALDEEVRYTTGVPKKDHHTGVPRKDQHSTAVDKQDHYAMASAKEVHYATGITKEEHHITVVDEEGPYTLVLGQEDHHTPKVTKEDPYILALDEDRYTVVVPKTDSHTTTADEVDGYTAAADKEDPYTLALDEDRYTTVVPKEDHLTATDEEDRYTAAADEEDPYSLPLDEDRYTTVVPKGDRLTVMEDEDPYILALDEDRYTTVVPKGDRHMATVTKGDHYRAEVTKGDHHMVDKDRERTHGLILPQHKSSADARKDKAPHLLSRPPAPIPRPVTLSEAPGTPFIAQVFQQRTGKGTDEQVYGTLARDVNPRRDDVYSLPAPVRRTPGVGILGTFPSPPPT
ncbi:phosphoinositide 3-kinase adapter protein 1-like isoform X2 [Pristis pectinata]|uniref:phosphoinositide 3-kinase adapter protein 1-like isoform X2 n=1 Tax=Pristis pectinata TaxID=685728 RepID=UPI00223D5C66|nr:phosphoinositide 3-kinase adapter protein 1-like isoform X2 [Pristis pectinata]